MILFSDGCDSYGVSGDIVRKWAANIGATYQSTGGRGGGGSIQQASPAATDYIQTPTFTGSPSTAGWGVSFSIKISSRPTADQVLLMLSDGQMEFVDGSNRGNAAFEVAAATGVVAVRGWENLATTPNFSGSTDICDNLWHHVEIYAYPANSGGSYQVWIDGSNEINWTGDTITGVSPPAFTGWQAARFLGVETETWDLDDVVIWDNQTGLTGDLNAASSPIGDNKIETIRPTGAGTETDFTPSAGANWAAVDDAGQDGDTTYVESSVDGEQDTYGFGNLGSTPTTVHAVVVNVCAKNSDAGAISVEGRARRSSSAQDSAVSRLLKPNYSTHAFSFPRDPSTSSAWDETGINAAEFGLKVDNP